MNPGSDSSAAELLLGQVPCAAVRLDGDHRIAYANPALAAMVGRDAAALHGQPFELLFTPAAGAMFQSYVVPVLALHGRIEEFALSVRTAAGGSVDVMIYARSDGQGARPGISAMLARYQTRKAVDDELLQIKRAADQSPAMLFELTCGAYGALRLTYVSQSAKALYGCSARQARADAGLILGQLPAETLQRLATPPSRSAGQPLQEEILVRRGRPDAAWHEWNALARHRSDGSVVWTGSVTDVSTRRALQDEAVELHAAEQARRSQGEFLSRLSHELRTPLNAVLGFTQLLAQDADHGASAVNRRHIELIASAGRRLLGLVDDVLDLSRLRSTGFGIRPTPLALAPLVEDSVSIFGPQALRANVRLETDIPADLWVDADAKRLTQVIDNLISNAIKYNRAGGSVTLRAALRDGGVAIEVRDTGIGMDEAQCRALFQPFNRLGVERLGIAGTGLGLVIAAQIVSALGGTIDAESAPGRGTCFTVRLPASFAAPAPPDAPPEAGRSVPGLDLTLQPQGCEVLYVEDDAVNAMLFEAIAEGVPGLRLQVAETGAHALELAGRTPPTLLLCDRHLPDTEAPELFAALRALPELADLPAVMVSGDAMPGAEALARQAGFLELWTKPLDVSQTRRRLSRLIASLTPQTEPQAS